MCQIEIIRVTRELLENLREFLSTRKLRLFIQFQNDVRA